MNKLDELIQQLCPSGVPHKRLGDIATISRGGSFQKKDFTESGIPCIHYGQIYTRYGLFVNETITYISEETAQKQKFAEPNDIVMAVTSENIEDVCKCVAWLGTDKVAVSGHAAIIHHSINPKYLVYWLHSSSFYQQKAKIASGTKVIEVAPAKLSDVLLPVPPLEVQREIVRILDAFTELTSELTENLSMELTARKQQYNYYRDKMLTFANDVKWMTIADICRKVVSGGTPPVGNSDYYGGNIPWLRTQEVDWKDITDTAIKITDEGLNNSSAKWIPANCVIVAMYGATAAKVAINKIPLTTNQACCNLEIDSDIALYRYVFHWLCKEYLSLKGLGQGSQSNINAQTVKQYKIPIPPLPVQQRIITVLDNFDAICSDLNIGLPAEIEARKKQYEFYRDQLLTFAAQGETILTDRQTDEYNALIRLCQYVFGYAFVKLSLVADVFRGEYITKKDSASGDVPVILGGQEPAYYIDKANHTGEAVVVARSGASAGFVSYWNEPIFVTDCFGFEARQDLITPKFLYYILKNMEQTLNDMKRGAGVPHLSGEALLNIPLCIPPIKEQERIVETLDRFDALCTDLSAGLPAEIEAREKQYEYYRDKLLTFGERFN